MIKEIEVRKLPSNKAKKFISKLINQYDKENPKSDLKTKSYQNEYLIYDIVNEDFKSWFWPKVTKDYYQKGSEFVIETLKSYVWTIRYYNSQGEVKHTVILNPVMKIDNTNSNFLLIFYFDPVTVNLPKLFPEYDFSRAKIFVKRSSKSKILQVRELRFNLELLKKNQINNLNIDFSYSNDQLPTSETTPKQPWIRKILNIW